MSKPSDSWETEFLQKYFGENQNMRSFERQRTQQQVALIRFLKLSQESLSHHDKKPTKGYDGVMCLRERIISHSERVNSKPAESRPSTPFSPEADFVCTRADFWGNLLLHVLAF